MVLSLIVVSHLDGREFLKLHRTASCRYDWQQIANSVARNYDCDPDDVDCDDELDTITVNGVPVARCVFSIIETDAALAYVNKVLQNWRAIG